MTKILLFVGMLICMVLANLTLKTGAIATTGLRILPGLPPINMTVIGSLFFFVGGFAFYFLILRTTPLNVAQSMAAGQFVAIIFAANLILGEPIGLLRWAGILFIAIGIVLVGLSADWQAHD